MKPTGILDPGTFAIAANMERAGRNGQRPEQLGSAAGSGGLTAGAGRALDAGMGQDDDIGRFVEAFGLAVLDLWSTLPQEIQHDLFEQAVLRGHKSERDESLREQLAQFLHAHHERTAKRNAGQTDPV